EQAAKLVVAGEGEAVAVDRDVALHRRQVAQQRDVAGEGDRVAVAGGEDRSAKAEVAVDVEVGGQCRQREQERCTEGRGTGEKGARSEQAPPGGHAGILAPAIKARRFTRHDRSSPTTPAAAPKQRLIAYFAVRL